MENIEITEKKNDSFEDFGMDIENKDLKIFALQIKGLFKDLRNDMLDKGDIEGITNRLINNHEKTCPLATKNILTTDNCYTEWKICHAKHSEESSQLTTARLSRFKEYREFFVWAAFASYIVFQALDFNKIFDLLK